jgi:hypothetical protein
VRAAPNALQLRAEVRHVSGCVVLCTRPAINMQYLHQAANKKAALKQQRAILEKYIYRISANDV